MKKATMRIIIVVHFVLVGTMITAGELLVVTVTQQKQKNANKPCQVKQHQIKQSEYYPGEGPLTFSDWGRMGKDFVRHYVFQKSRL